MRSTTKLALLAGLCHGLTHGNLAQAEAEPVLTAGTAASLTLVDNRVVGWGLKPALGLEDGRIGPTEIDVGVSEIAKVCSGPQAQYSCVLARGHDEANKAIKCFGATRRLDASLPFLVLEEEEEEKENSNSSATVTDIACGKDHACALFSHGKVKCWGQNNQGQLGTGDQVDRGLANGNNVDPATLSFVDLGSDAVAVAAGFGSTCAALASGPGHLKCWGFNRFSSLGHGLEEWSVLTPPELPIQLGGEIVEVVKSSSRTCVLLKTSETANVLRCWGENFNGELGYSDTTNRGNASAVGDVQLAGVSNIERVALGGNHGCAVLAGSKEVHCWGINTNGQLGLGSGIDANPVINDGAVSLKVDFGDGTVVDIAAGDAHTCIMVLDGTLAVRCWGLGRDGQLGRGFDMSDVGKGEFDMGGNLTNVDMCGFGWAATASGCHQCSNGTNKVSLADAGDFCLCDASSGLTTNSEGTDCVCNTAAGMVENATSPGAASCTCDVAVGFQDGAGEGLCECRAGFGFSVGPDGAPACTTCAPGTSSTGGASACLPCDSGTFSAAGADSCVACASSESWNGTACVLCDAALGFSPAGNQTSCACDSSKGFAESASGCLCLSGFGYNETEVGPTCTPCASGETSPGGTGACLACSALEGLVPNDAQTACECDDAAGFVGSADGCVCKPGFGFSNASGAKVCTPCEAGAASSGGTSGCSIGSFPADSAAALSRAALSLVALLIKLQN